MQARCFCPEHGRLDFENILIKNGTPTCAKCSRPLEYGRVMPRHLAAPAKGTGRKAAAAKRPLRSRASRVATRSRKQNL